MFCHSNSNYNNSIAKSVINGELLRHRRLTNSNHLIKIHDQCIKQELLSRGYKENIIDKFYNSRLYDLQKYYTDDFTKKEIRRKPFTYISNTRYDGKHRTHKILRKILKRSLSHSCILKNTSLPMIVPGKRLKQCYYTRRNYLKRCRSFLESINN